MFLRNFIEGYSFKEYSKSSMLNYEVLKKLLVK